MRKRDLYFKIARDYTPMTVRWVQIQNGRWNHRGELVYGVAFTIRGYMIVPTPNTIGRLWTYLHECGHMALHLERKLHHVEEWEANQYAAAAFEKYGLKQPQWEVEMIARMAEDERAGVPIDEGINQAVWDRIYSVADGQAEGGR